MTDGLDIDALIEWHKDQIHRHEDQIHRLEKFREPPTTQLSGWPPHEHIPVQHRDGRPPWCEVCSLDADGEIPMSKISALPVVEKPFAVEPKSLAVKEFLIEEIDAGPLGRWHVRRRGSRFIGPQLPPRTQFLYERETWEVIKTTPQGFVARKYIPL